MQSDNQVEMLKANYFAAKAELAKLPTVGKRMQIEREGKESVSVIVYAPKENRQRLPVYIYCHGGAWIANNAIQMDDFCNLHAS